MCLPAFGQDFCIRVFDHQSRDQELSKGQKASSRALSADSNRAQ
jgi:hypothetical protein